MSGKLTLEATLEMAVLQGEIDEAVEETLAQSDEQIAAELKADGVDLDALQIRLQARLQKLLKQTAPKNGMRVRDKIKWFGAGAGTTVALGAAARFCAPGAHETKPPVMTAPSSPSAPFLAAAPAPDLATVLRKEAFAACGRGQWDECISKLDDAKAIDPSGDAAPEVAAARKRAAERK